MLEQGFIFCTYGGSHILVSVLIKIESFHESSPFSTVTAKRHSITSIATMAKTPNNTPNKSDSKHSPTKGKKLSIKFDFSPMKKKNKYGNFIDVYQTKVDMILVGVATRFDKPEGNTSVHSSLLLWLPLPTLIRNF